LEEVQHGEEIVIAKAGHPIAELKIYTPKRNNIKFGLLKGKIKYHGDIVAPDPDIIEQFEHSRLFPDA
jgi:antitoxin (DNA-binding transcriptional repressor) of toxin-antitoxin stability system